MTTRFKNYIHSLMLHLRSMLGKLIVAITIVIIIMLAFYWNFGFQNIHVKYIPTEGGRVTDILINPEFFLVLATIIMFYLGYRVLTREKRAERVTLAAIEKRSEIILKYLFSIALGVIGAWFIYSEFSRIYIWSYYTPTYVKISRQVTISGTTIPLSLILTIIAFLLLLNWYVIVEVYFGYKKLRTAKGKENKHR